MSLNLLEPGKNHGKVFIHDSLFRQVTQSQKSHKIFFLFLSRTDPRFAVVAYRRFLALQISVILMQVAAIKLVGENRNHSSK